MPYIVTTKRPKARADASPDFDVSSVAVATLARYCPRHGLTREVLCQASLGSDGQGMVFCKEPTLPLPEAGGTVGPLQDGSLIEVEPTTYYALWHAVPWDSGLRGGAYMETEGEQNIAAFNEANRVPS